MKTKGMVQTQLGYAEKVRPQGDIAPAWQAFLERQIEIDEARRYQEEERALVPDTTENARSPFLSLKALTFLLP